MLGVHACKSSHVVISDELVFLFLLPSLTPQFFPSFLLGWALIKVEMHCRDEIALNSSSFAR